MKTWNTTLPQLLSKSVNTSTMIESEINTYFITYMYNRLKISFLILFEPLVTNIIYVIFNNKAVHTIKDWHGICGLIFLICPAFFTFIYFNHWCTIIAQHTVGVMRAANVIDNRMNKVCIPGATNWSLIFIVSSVTEDSLIFPKNLLEMEDPFWIQNGGNLFFSRTLYDPLSEPERIISSLTSLFWTQFDIITNIYKSEANYISWTLLCQ